MKEDEQKLHLFQLQLVTIIKIKDPEERFDVVAADGSGVSELKCRRDVQVYAPTEERAVELVEPYLEKPHLAPSEIKDRGKYKATR